MVDDHAVVKGITLIGASKSRITVSIMKGRSLTNTEIVTTKGILIPIDQPTAFCFSMDMTDDPRQSFVFLSFVSFPVQVYVKVD
jgi:hypothetical protein